ncbi:MAG: hypothetical protein HC809_03945 [Gammaproteobacteria bacterium]|nr:hypothetical protein [Gammaproteobacteria bacterium]
MSVSIETVNQDLARLEADVRHLADDSRRLIKDVGKQARLVQDEAVAAQFIATEETIGNAGSILEAMASLRDIQKEQLRQFFEDQRESFNALKGIRSPIGLLEVGLDHWQRRARHVAAGLNQAVDVVSKESRHRTAAMAQMWQPFLRLVQNDWRK